MYGPKASVNVRYSLRLGLNSFITSGIAICVHLSRLAHSDFKKNSIFIFLSILANFFWLQKLFMVVLLMFLKVKKQGQILI